MGSSWQLAMATMLPRGQTSRRQFFFNEALPMGARNIHHACAPVHKLGIVFSEPGHGVATFCSTILRLDDGRYRLYYTRYPGEFTSMRIAVAESNDGLRWSKVNVGNDDNRIVFEDFQANQNFVGQPQVLRLKDGGWRMYFWHHEKGYRYTVAHSDDGLRWRTNRPAQWTFVDNWLQGRAPLENGWAPGLDLPAGEATELWRQKLMRTNDASYVYYNEQLDRFEYYAQWMVPSTPGRRVEEDNCPGAHRYIQRRFSQDGFAWSAPELVIMPDNRDPWDLQFYHLPVQWHDDWMIGSIGHYRVEANQQTQDLELVFSREGRHWYRPLRGGFIPRGKPGEPDCEGVYPPNAWIDEGETWLCLYTGAPLKHRQTETKDPSLTSTVLGARWPKNRFVGLAAGRVTGGFISDVFYPQADVITVDADIRGRLKAELCDVFGGKLAGYHLDDSETVHGNSTAHALKWKGKDTACFKFDAVRVRFEFENGEIFGIGF